MAFPRALISRAARVVARFTNTETPARRTQRVGQAWGIDPIEKVNPMQGRPFASRVFTRPRGN